MAIVWEDLHGDSSHLVGVAPLGGFDRPVGDRFIVDWLPFGRQDRRWRLIDTARSVTVWFPTRQAAQAEAERQLTYPGRRHHG